MPFLVRNVATARTMPPDALWVGHALWRMVPLSMSFLHRQDSSDRYSVQLQNGPRVKGGEKSGRVAEQECTT